MTHRAWTRPGALCALVALVVLAACGGGGGGGGSEPAPPPLPGPSTLIPAPPALGATLETDATALLPQVEGASWIFWGRQSNAAGTELLRYETRYTLTRSGSDWLLKGSNSGNAGADEERFTVTAGEVQQIESLQFAANQPAESLRFALLRSPVRVGDQVSVFSRRLDAVGDQDGDGKSDSLDVAAYVRVIGREDVTLASGAKVSAVRVETHFLQRPLLSKTNQFGPTVELVGVDWFAKSLGWVRRQAPTIAPSGIVLTNDEQLVAADAGEAGLGAAEPLVLVNPADSPDQAGQPLTVNFPAIQRVAGGVLVVGQNPVITYPGRQLLTLLDKRGRVQWSRVGPPSMRRFSTLGTGLVGWEPTDGNFFIQRLDARGGPLTADAQRIDMGGDPAVVVSLRSFQLAADAQSLWVSAIRQDRVALPNGAQGFRDGVVVRGFDTSGQPITEPILLARNESDGFLRTLPTIAVTNGSAVVSWGQTVSGVPQLLTARISGNGQVQRGVAITDGVGTDPVADLAGSTGGVSLQSAQGISWLDDSLVRTGLDGVGSFTMLASWTGLADAIGVDSRALTGESLLRWGFEAGNTVTPPAGASSSWQALRLQLFRRGQAAPERRILLSYENAAPAAQLVFLDDCALVLRQVATPDGQRWTSRVIWLNP